MHVTADRSTDTRHRAAARPLDKVTSTAFRSNRRGRRTPPTPTIEAHAPARPSPDDPLPSSSPPSPARSATGPCDLGTGSEPHTDHSPAS